MFDVQSIAIYYSESIESVPGTASRFFFRTLYYSSGSILHRYIKHFLFHIRCIAVHKLFFLAYFLLPFNDIPVGS